MTFPAYPKYKDSGVEWFDNVPNHWDVMSIKWLSNVQRGASPRPIDDQKYFDDEGEYAWVRISDVSSSSGVLRETTQRLSDLGSSLSVKLSPNTLFVSIAGTVGKPCITEIHACIHDGFVYFPNLKINPKWLFRIFEGGLCYAGLGKMGTQLNLNTDTIGSIKIPVPTSREIEEILKFLDHETARIDALICEQEKLIELLNEKIVSMTLGISTNKSDQYRLKDVATVISRPVIQKKEETYTPIGLFNRGRGLFHKEPRQTEEMGDSDFFWIEAGDLIISGQFAWEGAVAFANQQDSGCVVSHRYPVLRGRDDILKTEYLLAWLMSRHGDFLLNENSRGAAGRNRPLNINSLLKEKISIPPIEVQTSVSKVFHERVKLFSEIKKQIEFLQERRSALISAAVTGQIDVRNHVPKE